MNSFRFVPAASAGLAVLVLFLALIWPADVYPGMKFPLAALMFLILFLCAGLRPGNEEPPSPGPFLSVIIFPLFFLCLLISSVFGANSYVSAETVLAYASAVAYAAGLILLGAARERFVNLFEVVFLGCVVFLCVYGVHQYLFSLPVLVTQAHQWAAVSNEQLVPVLTRLSGGRIFSRFALPSTFSCVILAALPLVHRLLIASGRPWMEASLLALMTACLVLARSYAAVLLFAAYWTIDAWRRYPAARKYISGGSAVLILSILFLLRPDALFDFSHQANPVRLRWDNWKTAWSEFRSAPLVGVGPGNFGTLFLFHRTGATETRFAHGFHMTILAETGAIGFFLWVVLSALFWRWILFDRPRYAASLALLYLYSLVDMVFEFPSMCVLFFILLGFCAPAWPARVIVRGVRSSLAAVAIAGAAFSLVLFQAADYHEIGMETLRKFSPTSNDLVKAEEQFRRSARLWPSPDNDAALGRTRLLLARTEQNPSHLDEARAHFSDAVRKSPHTASFYAGLGEALIAEGKTAEAASAFKKAARLNPRGPYAGWFLQLMLGDEEKGPPNRVGRTF